MPDSRRRRTLDHGRSAGNPRNRGRTDTRPHAHRRSSSYDDKHYSRSHRSRYHGDSDYSSDYASDYSSPPPRASRRRARSEVRSRRSRRSLSRDSTLDEEMTREKRDQAIKSAVTAGAVEAFRQRKRPGEWLGEKGLRVATAAMSAAAIDSAMDKNPRRHGAKKVVGSTLGGLVVDKLTKGLLDR